MTASRGTQLLKRTVRPVLRVTGAPVAGAVLFLLRLTRLRAGVALMYHGLAERTGDTRVELVPPHGARLFEVELRHLARRYRVVPAADLLDAAARRRRGERFPAAVTFDDDLSSHVTVALPALRRAGAHATFFLTGTCLERPFTFWWQRLQNAVDTDPERLPELFAAVGAQAPPRIGRAGIHELGRRVEELPPADRDAFAEALPANERDPGLRAEDIRELVAAGMAIGFHTRRHDLLPRLSDDELAEALEAGREQLDAVAGERLTVIGYPYGRADRRVADAARRAGFRVGFTGVSGPVRPGDDPLLLCRLDPSYRSVGHFALQLVTALLRAHARTTPSSGSR